MSDKPVFNVNKKLFDRLTDWHKKMESQDQSELETELDNKAKKNTETLKKSKS